MNYYFDIKIPSISESELDRLKELQIIKEISSTNYSTTDTNILHNHINRLYPHLGKSISFLIRSLTKLSDMKIEWKCLPNKIIHVMRKTDNYIYDLHFVLAADYPWHASRIYISNASNLNTKYDYHDDNGHIIYTSTNNGLVYLCSMIEDYSPAVGFADIIFDLESCFGDLKPMDKLTA